MSRYLIDRIQAHERINVRNRAEVIEARGDERISSVVIRDAERGEEIEANAEELFVMIGTQPMTAGVEGWLHRDKHGFLVTGADLLNDGGKDLWPLDRPPLSRFGNRAARCSRTAGWNQVRIERSGAQFRPD